MSRRSIRGVAAAVALCIAGAACGSDGDKGKKADTDPHELRAPASEVAAGLGQIDVIMGQIGLSVGANTKTAREQVEGIEDLWSPIEGTIRENETDQYLRFEDDFAALKSATAAGDVAKTQSTAADVSAAVKAYVSKFPA